jgi:ribosome-associated translation inhibitor RaiA
VVCCDTLGQDKEISEADRKYIEQKVRLLGESWEKKEKELLSSDVDLQIEYL